MCSTVAGLQDLGQDAADDLDESNLPRENLLATAGARALPATWLWWVARLLTLQQRLLSGPSSSLRSALTKFAPKVP